MKISVIIPTYAPGNYIFDCLNSIINQTIQCDLYEIIVILNGPKEPYFGILSNIENINLYYSENKGVSNARNIGLNKAKGEYICFIDDDDIVSHNYLEALLNKSSNNTIAVSNVYSFIDNTNEKRENFFICKHLRKTNNGIHSSLFKNRSFLAFPVAKLIHKDIIGERRFNCQFNNGEDALFITSISNNIKNIVYAGNDVIYYVRERIGSASRKKIPIKKNLTDMFSLIGTYIITYIKKPLSYNFILFLSRIPGVIKNTYYLMKNK